MVYLSLTDLSVMVDVVLLVSLFVCLSISVYFLPYLFSEKDIRDIWFRTESESIFCQPLLSRLVPFSRDRVCVCMCEVLAGEQKAEENKIR